MTLLPRFFIYFNRPCATGLFALLLFEVALCPLRAQTAPATPGTARPGTAGQVLTLPGVVARVLGNNSGLELARQRLERAQEAINQVNAQIRPQFRLNANDTYSSYPAFPAALPVPTILAPALPDGGQIPAVTDQASSFSTAFAGSSISLGGSSAAASPGIAGGTATGGTGTAAPGTTGPNTPGTTTPGVSGTGASGNGGNAPASGTGNGTTAPNAGATAPNTGATPGSSNTGTPNTNAPATPNTNAPAAPNGNAPTPNDAAPATPGGTAPGTNAPATPNNAPTPNSAVPAAPSGNATPNGGAAPNNAPAPNGGAAPSTGTGAVGTATYPAIVADYVFDPRTLLPPPAEAHAPVARPPAARTQADAKADADSQPDASPRPDATTDGTTTPGVTPVRGRRDTYAAGGNVTQYIDLFGLVGAARATEGDVRDFYALDITRLQNETALAAKNLFFNVLYAQSLVATQQEQVAYAQENVRITQSRLQNGIAARFDVLTAQAALATAQQQQTAAQDQYELAQSELSYLIGTDPDQPSVLQTPPLPPLTQTVDLQGSTRLAERQRPELAQAARNVDNARRQARLAQQGLLPTLGVVGSGEYTSNGSTITPRSYGTVSVQAAVPLDDGGLTRSRVRSAQVQVQTQTLTQEQLQLSVALEVRQATVNIRNAQAEAAAAQVGTDRSQEAVRLARERYGAGFGTFLDVLNALAQLAAARTNLANAQYFYQSSLAQLVRAMGGR